MVRGTSKGQMLGIRQLHQADSKGTKDLGGRQPLYLRKERGTSNGIGGWSSRQQSPLRRRGML
jgi:hypothetical protein